MRTFASVTLVSVLRRYDCTVLYCTVDMDIFEILCDAQNTISIIIKIKNLLRGKQAAASNKFMRFTWQCSESVSLKLCLLHLFFSHLEEKKS